MTDERHDGLDRPPSHAAVTEVGPLGVVVGKPGIEIGLERLDAVVEAVPHGHAEELVEHGAVKALDKAIGAGRSDASAAVFDAVEVEIELV